ncbi:MAG: RluA family pseudouridine synthase [Lachnospiraceae bacterium]|nr:RluA family pseudouridine synthase [Lachnospiraceae bacterium]
MQSFTIGKNQAGQRFDKFLVKYLPGAPKSLLYKQLRKKNITLNKRKAEGSEILKIGDVVESFFSDETFEKFCNVSFDKEKTSEKDKYSDTDNPSLSRLNKENNKTDNKKDSGKKNPSVVYEDMNIIIINKPVDMLSQKSKEEDYSVNDWLIEYCLNTGKITEKELKTFKPSICNRLDRNTSGLLICGCSLKGLQVMSEFIREGRIEKYYLTICHGVIDKAFSAKALLKKNQSANKSGIENIEVYDYRGIPENENDIKSKPANKHKKDNNSSPKGEIIITDFKPVKVFENATLLEVNLHTGKSHQIRAQLSALGHPILGDRKYGCDFEDKKKYGLDNQLLQAYKLVFPDMISDEDFAGLKGRVIEIKPSPDFEKAISKLG